MGWKLANLNPIKAVKNTVTAAAKGVAQVGGAAAKGVVQVGGAAAKGVGAVAHAAGQTKVGQAVGGVAQGVGRAANTAGQAIVNTKAVQATAKATAKAANAVANSAVGKAVGKGLGEANKAVGVVAKGMNKLVNGDSKACSLPLRGSEFCVLTCLGVYPIDWMELLGARSRSADYELYMVLTVLPDTEEPQVMMLFADGERFAFEVDSTQWHTITDEYQCGYHPDVPGCGVFLVAHDKSRRPYQKRFLKYVEGDIRAGMTQTAMLVNGCAGLMSKAPAPWLKVAGATVQAFDSVVGMPLGDVRSGLGISRAATAAGATSVVGTAKGAKSLFGKIKNLKDAVSKPKAKTLSVCFKAGNAKGGASFGARMSAVVKNCKAAAEKAAGVKAGTIDKASKRFGAALNVYAALSAANAVRDLHKHRKHIDEACRFGFETAEEVKANLKAAAADVDLDVDSKHALSDDEEDDDVDDRDNDDDDSDVDDDDDDHCKTADDDDGDDDYTPPKLVGVSTTAAPTKLAPASGSAASAQPKPKPNVGPGVATAVKCPKGHAMHKYANFVIPSAAYVDGLYGCDRCGADCRIATGNDYAHHCNTCGSYDLCPKCAANATK